MCYNSASTLTVAVTDYRDTNLLLSPHYNSPPPPTAVQDSRPTSVSRQPPPPVPTSNTAAGQRLATQWFVLFCSVCNLGTSSGVGSGRSWLVGSGKQCRPGTGILLDWFQEKDFIYFKTFFPSWFEFSCQFLVQFDQQYLLIISKFLFLLIW